MSSQEEFSKRRREFMAKLAEKEDALRAIEAEQEKEREREENEGNEQHSAE